MLPRLKLIQCFNCKNNIECWGLNEDIPLGKNEREYSIPTKALTFLIAQNMESEECNLGEQFGMFCAAFLQTLRYDSKSKIGDIYQVINVLRALSNTSNDHWYCPGEEPGPEENGFVFVERTK